jgi:hypothetical protein
VLWLSTCAVATLASPVTAQETVVGGYFGRGQGVNVYGVEAVLKPQCECAWLKEHDLQFNVLLRAALWDAYHHQSHGTLGDFSALGALDWSGPQMEGWRPVLEAALGVHGLTRVDIGNQNMGSAFQFGERLAAGIRFGSQTPWSIMGFIEHVSNADIKQPNDGLTYGGVEIRVSFP